MKILLTGNHNPYFTNTVELREKAARDLGHKLIFFNDRSFFLPGRLRDRCPGLQKWDLNAMNKRLLAMVKMTRPDFCLVVGGHRVLRETVLAIKEREVKVFLWTTDVPSDFSNILKAAVFYDHIFCAGTEAVDILGRYGINKTSFLPFACDPELHHPVILSDKEKEKYSRDIVFVGSYYPNRQKVLEEIAALDVSVWGPGWDSLPDRSPLKGKVVDKPVNYHQWLKLYSGAKIVLAVHFRDHNIPSKQASPRVFEAMACKKLVFSDRQEDVVSLFREDHSIIYFDPGGSLTNKLAFYLANDKERFRIAEAGYEEVLNKHKYTDRLKVIINKFNRIK